MSIQSEALKNYFAQAGIRQRDIAERLGLSAPVVSNMLAGRDPIGRGRADALCEAYGFNKRFLLTGVGDLFGTDAVSVEVSHNSGHSQNTVNVSSSDEARIAALEAEIARLKDENAWLRDLVSSKNN